ncbi:MAG: chalcone isomerase family protein [Bdellovibrionales bacterium]|nr:chalcone isomerase family protein [Bdellovibrionales bacterium]
MRWLLSILLFSAIAQAKSLEGADFSDELTLGPQKLLLNGLGLRTKKKFGINFRVYVGGLYTVNKASDALALIDSPETVVVELAFLRGLDKATLQEAWSEGFAKNCKSECEAAKAQLTAFNALMTDVKDKSRLRVVFNKDSVTAEVSADGKILSSGKVDGQAFRKAMLAVFIGDHPPTDELKKGLLGG